MQNDEVPILRDVVQKVTDQMREWGMVDASFERILAESVFAGNALLIVGGCTPYTAVYGRVPRVLLDIYCQRGPGEASVPWPGALRGVHLLREAVVEAMVQRQEEMKVK